jgi:hypothetical protein
MENEYAELLQAIIKASGDTRIELTHSIPSLMEALRGRMAEVQLVVMAASDSRDLEAPAAMKEIFSLVKSIIVLKHREQYGMELSNSLRPRYIAFLDEGGDNVCAVIRRILSKRENRSHDSPAGS